MNWRDSWEDDATGVWVRGGHQLDQHDHQDRGHVNFICRGQPILIEAGTPDYSNPRIMTHYTSNVGHNVLQIGAQMPTPPFPPADYVCLAGWQKPHTVAPLTVRRLDQSGGEVSVDVSAGYQETETWAREVTWTGSELTVRDIVKLGPGVSDIIVFRWHLGVWEPISITARGHRHRVEWAEAVITFEATAPLQVSQDVLPDATLGGDRPKDEQGDPLHTCVVVRSRGEVGKLSLTTKVVPK